MQNTCNASILQIIFMFYVIFIRNIVLRTLSMMCKNTIIIFQIIDF